jgi:hypothetical protein
MDHLTRRDARIAELERQQVESDALLYAHASLIDKRPPSEWPVGPLRAACARHVITTGTVID